jgi:paraquat-inducible protein A
MFAITDRTRFKLACALVTTGFILYIPSNVMPVMTMTLIGNVEPLTVLGGVNELLQSGLPLMAGVVFLASFLVPFLKLVSLAWILSLHGKPQMQRERSNLHRLVRKIGSWSMIDIFLLSVLAGLGQLGALAGVTAEPGAIFFSIVLLCSLLAVEIYKPRLIWESLPSELQ